MAFVLWIMRVFLSFFLLFPLKIYSFQPIHTFHEHKTSIQNLKVFPSTVQHLEFGEEVTIGDLHGNAMKLIYFLVSYGILEIAPSEYLDLYRVYDRYTELLTHNDIERFNEIINRAVINTHAKIRFIGDELCDRGMNDYFTLKVIEKMAKSNLDFEFVLSNHAFFFIKTYESSDQSFSENPYGGKKHESVVRSMLNMGKIITRGLISKEEIIYIVENFYLPHIKLIGTTINPKKRSVVLYTHAPVDLKIIHHFATDIGLPFRDYSIQAINSSLYELNGVVASWLKKKQFSLNYYHLLERYNSRNTNSPLKLILWNRNYMDLERKHHLNSYKVFYVHGHDSESHIVDLDTTFGKGDKAVGQFSTYLANQE